MEISPQQCYEAVNEAYEDASQEDKEGLAKFYKTNPNYLAGCIFAYSHCLQLLLMTKGVEVPHEDQQ